MGVCEKDPVRSGLEKRERVVVESTRVILLDVGGWVVQKGLPRVYTKPIPGSVAVAGFSIRFRGMSQIFLLGFVVVVVLGPETRYFMVLIIIIIIKKVIYLQRWGSTYRGFNHGGCVY